MYSPTIASLLDFKERKMSAENLREFLFIRDYSLKNDLINQGGKREVSVDSASFFFLSPEVVIDTFPQAQFIFVLRDCASWIVSIIDMEIRVLRWIQNRTINLDLRSHSRYVRSAAPHYSPEMFKDTETSKKRCRSWLQNWQIFGIPTLYARSKHSKNYRPKDALS